MQSSSAGGMGGGSTYVPLSVFHTPKGQESSNPTPLLGVCLRGMTCYPYSTKVAGTVSLYLYHPH